MDTDNLDMVDPINSRQQNHFTLITREHRNGCNSPQGSKFNLIISGNWTTLAISLNGKTIEYTEAGPGTLIIDNVEMEVKLNGLNKLSALDGDIDSFLNIVPGENTIGVSGTGLNITVTIDFIPQWL